MSKKRLVLNLSPLSLLTLTACGGGEGGGGGGSSFVSTAGSTSGFAFQGPLSNALIYIDYDDAALGNSATVRTGANGNYTLSTLNNNYTIVVVTDDSTVDTSSGSVFSGVTMKAASGGTAVSTATTMMVEGGLTVAQLNAVLGLSADIDHLTFNPFAAGVDAGKALAVEKASKQIFAVVNAFAGAIEGSGASRTDAFKTALNAVVDVIATKAGVSGQIDLTNNGVGGDLTTIKGNVTTALTTGVTNADLTSFTAMANDTATAIKNVNVKISTATDLTSDATKNIFSTTGVLVDQIKTAVDAEKTTVGSGDIGFKTMSTVDTASTNKTPTDITMSSTSISEAGLSLAIGTLGTTDDQSSTTFTYAIAEVAGSDWQAFSISAGVLSLKTQADFETKPTYNVTILSTDEGGKTFSKNIEVSVTDANDAPTVANAIADLTFAEDVPISYQFAANAFADVDAGDTLTYVATLSNGAVLSMPDFNADTRTFTGTPLNAHVGTHTVKITATDTSGASVYDTFNITITNTNDAPTVANEIADQTASSGSALSYQFNTNVFADVDVGDSFTYSATLSNGSALPSWLSFNASTRTFSGTPADGDVGSIAVKVTATDTGSATVSDTFNMTVNANVAPSSVALSSNAVAENSAGGTVGTVSASDANGDALTYSLASGGDNDYFEISGTTLKFKNSVTGNYEANNSYSITVNASDGTATASLNTLINVTNINEANASTHTSKADTASSETLNSGNDAAVELLMSGRFWGTAGSGIDLNYSFMGSGSSFKSNYNDGTPRVDHAGNVLTASVGFKAAVANIFNDFSSVSLLNFSEVADNGSSVGHLRFGTTSLEDSAFAWIPFNDPVGGDVWLSSTDNNFNDAAKVKDGTYWNTTITHELGHALGLSHTQDAATLGSKTYGTTTTTGSIHNSNPYSTMAYAEWDGDSHGAISNMYYRPTTLMIDDIAALQHLYGVNEQYNTDDDVYTLGSFDGGTTNDNHIYASIWDAGGTDTISWVGQSSIASINLNAGAFSCFGNISGTDDSDLGSNSWSAGDGILGIAHNVVIENAKGGSGIDTIVGNTAANILYGGSGSGVKDTLTGGGGADTFVCSLSDAVTTLNLADVISDFTNGTDKIGLEDRAFSDLTISNSSGDTKIVDTSSNKVLFVLDTFDFNLIDSTDFVVTDFV